LTFEASIEREVWRASKKFITASMMLLVRGPTVSARDKADRRKEGKKEGKRGRRISELAHRVRHKKRGPYVSVSEQTTCFLS
jgi:hypothetical protein